MTLFDHRRQKIATRSAPLSARMRPGTLEQIMGQDHILGEGKVLRRAIEEDRIRSLILWGPPGTGKTTIARVIASATQSYFETISAVNSGVRDIRAAVQGARDRLGMDGRQTIVFVDEIHRFNKSQQDALLPDVEEGNITLIGATTENPSFEVIGPLLSRARVFRLESLSDDDISALIDRALKDPELQGSEPEPVLTDEARALLIRVANGDARHGLDSLELAVASTEPSEDGVRLVSIETVENAVQQQSRYDKTGDLHYDTISAFLKTIRGSDPDAALYWLARMLDAGEDLMFIARRLVIASAEDVGLADPQAIRVAVAAQQAVHLIGMPEARIILAETTVYLASAPKSNSAYMAINKALADVRDTRNDPVPMHLRNAPTKLMKDMGHGEGYKYSHDYEDNFAAMENRPENIRGHRYYEPGVQGFESRIGDRLRRLWKDGRYGTPPRDDN
ncbi:MAG TPA: replication-associated recombination protein A [Dehalococcoidia bacterium]|jgi:putative ATPase|nr:replication-associated recombination protein A [Dehalococcoidia bacterium]MDP6274531.1 replication-associated recombination protein A [Dehalococcoidia bacterium]MDP7161682.1 replication-associated recombination protein A [Dehalococcoidia bacterium]MDP7213971.1 replication-associated recombination protein A [Dehalococcoidia bacterium]MDP7514439.1 replication-associated recombination protein A [Dehalococcoidia bacterium]